MESFSCFSIIFVDPKTVFSPNNIQKTEDQFIPKGYALLFFGDQEMAPSEVTQLFSENSIAIIHDTIEVVPSRDAEKFQAGEIQIKLFHEDPNIYISCHDYYLLFLRELFNNSSQVKVSYCDFSPLQGESIDQKSLHPIQKLLEVRPDMPFWSPKVGTLLHFAVDRGSVVLLNLLIKCGANINQKKRDGSTALHLAVSKNNQLSQLLVPMLVEHGASIDATTNNGATPLLKAIEHGCFWSVEFILNRKPNTTVEGNKQGFYRALLGRSKNHAELAGRMVEQGFYNALDFTEKSQIFFDAIKRYPSRIVQRLLDLGFAVNQSCLVNGKTLTSLHFAIQRKRGDIVRLLLKRDANVNVKRYGLESPLVFAAKHGHANIVEMLLKAGACLYGERDRLLLTAVSRPNVLRVLLEAGLDPNLPSKNGKTCMSQIWKSCSLKALNCLIKFGARCEYADVEDVRSASPDFYEIFLEHCPINISASDVQRLSKMRREEIQRHLDRLKAVNSLDSVRSENLKMGTFPLSCMEEAEKLNEYIPPTLVRYRDILSDDVYRVPRYFKNPDIANMCSNAVRYLFPIYFSVLMRKAKMGAERRRLLDEALPVMRVLFSQLSPSHPLGQSVVADDMIEIISSFLGIRDLIILPKCLPAKQSSTDGLEVSLRSWA